MASCKGRSVTQAVPTQSAKVETSISIPADPAGGGPVPRTGRTALDATSRSAASDVRSRLPPVSGPPVPRPTQRARRRSRRRGWGRRTSWAGVNQNPRRPASPVRPPESICRRLSLRYAVARSFSDGASRSRPACRQAAPKRSRPTPPAPTARRSARAPAAWRRATSPPRRARGSSKGRQATQHSAYRFEFVTVAYRWHPLHGRRLRAHQGARRDARDVVLVEDRPGLTRELPAWMCDAAACSAMTFGPPLVQVDAPQALSAFLATLLQARTASRSSEPRKKEEVTGELAACRT